MPWTGIIVTAIWTAFLLVWFVKNVVLYFTRKSKAPVTDFTRYRDPKGHAEFDVPTHWIIRHRAGGIVQFRDPDRERGSLFFLPSLLPSRILSFSIEQGAEETVSFGELSDFVTGQCRARGYRILSINEAQLDDGTVGCLVDYQAIRRERRLVVLHGCFEYNLNLSTFPDEFDAGVFDQALRSLSISEDA